MARHVFVDNSNIWGGAFRVKDLVEPDVYWPALRMDLENLFRLVEGEGEVGIRAFAASGAKTAEAIWERARANGYDTYILSRIEVREGKEVEQGVDEIVHLAMANAVLDHAGDQTLVLASGDGRTSNFGTSFVAQVERALRKGWSAEVWSWSPTMTTGYQGLKAEYGDRLVLRTLDEFYTSLTWVRAGSYRREGGPSVEVAGRQSRSLPART